MNKLGDQVLQLMLVKKDVASMQDDLRTQQTVWHEAELQLRQQNDGLARQGKELQASVRDGESVKLEVTKLEQAVKDEKQKKAVAEATNEQYKQGWQVQTDTLNMNVASLMQMLKSHNRTARDM